LVRAAGGLRGANAARAVSLLVLAAVAANGIGCATEAGTGAAVALGAILGTGFAAQAATKSELRVDVEVYDDRADVRADPTGRLFRLDRELSIRRSIGEAGGGGAGGGNPAGCYDSLTAEPTPADLEVIRRRLQPLIPQLESSAAALTQRAKEMRALGERVGPESKDILEKIQRDFAAQAAAAQEVIKEFRRFQDALGPGKEKGPRPDNAEAQAALCALRLAAARAGRPLAPETLELLRSQIGAALRGAVLEAGDSPARQAQLFARIDELENTPLVPVDDLPPLVLVIHRARVIASSLPGAAPRLAELFRGIGIDIRFDPGAPLTLGGTFNDLQSGGGGGAGGVLAASLSTALTARRIHAATFSSLTSGVSLGPIANEVMQGVLSRGTELGLITAEENKKNWRLLNFARSDGAQGNHDTVIYLENLGTPLVKSSTFDPTKFVVAHGAIYRTFFNAAANAFGAPISADNPAAAATLPDVSVIGARARLREARQRGAGARGTVVSAMGSAIGVQDDVKAAADAAGVWDAAKKQAALDAAQAALRDAAAALRAPPASAAPKP
jgi:hypothetical protein